MAGSNVQALAEVYAELGALPEAAREELGVELAIIGRDVLAQQKQLVPKRTGALEAGLGLQLVLDRLRVKIGLLNVRAGRSKLFYGRIIQFGRSAQTVLVTRHLKVLGRRGNNRKGNRRRTLRAGKPYPMKVRAMAARPFVQRDDWDAIDAAARGRLADFWANVLKRSGAGS